MVMTSNEIKKIIDGLDVLKEINVYYNIEEITNPMHAYIKTYWQKNKDKYIGRSLIAILVSKKLLANDPMYFLDEGVVIGGYYISYNELNWVGKFSLFHGEKIENDYMICYGNEKTLRILAEHKTRTFACNVIEKIIEKDNLLHNNGDKIKYYLNLYVRIEGSKEVKV